MSIPIAIRRARRQRRIADVVRTQLRVQAQHPWSRQLLVGTGVAITILVGLIAMISRTAPAPVQPTREDYAPLAYTPDELRPDLDEADDSIPPTPASYTVTDGDTLLAIAFRYGSSVEAIRVANGLSDVDFLNIGQTLTIPPVRSVIQEVDPYQTIREIADAFNAPVEAVALYNGRSADIIDEPLARNVAVLPPGPAESPTRALASTRGGVPVGGRTSTADGVTVYTVAEGDTILDIAETLGVPASALVAANRLGDSDLIIAGHQLTLPVWTRPAEESDSDAIADADGVVRAAFVTDGSEAQTTTADRPRAPVVYEVAAGDTISTLAEQFGVDPDTIVFTNELSSADRIRAGDQLTILPVSGLMYTVRAGDTLADIAATYKVDLGPILDFNYLDDADTLGIGKELILPGARPLPPPPPPPPLPTNYTVQQGDTVGGIAYRFGVSSDDVIAANNLRSADRISIGTSLRIAAGAAQVAARLAPAAAQPSTQSTSSSTSQPATIRSAPAPQQQVTVNRPVPPPAPTAATRQSSPGGGGGIASAAMPYVGYRYVFGGTTPAGFDCSGFVYYVHSRAGRPISRGMWGQYNAGSHPGRGELQPGDIVFFQNTYMAGLSHNGIYIGNGQFIHASDERSGVKVSSLSESYWASHWFGATRAW